ncbi:hypothetical protein ACJX0J_001744 [Zea mays]
MAVVSIEEIKEVEKFVDLWLKKKNKKTGVLLNFKGLRRLLGKRQRLLAYLAKKNRNKNKDMSLSLKRKDLMIVNMGPQHPSMHGVLRLIVTLDGEDVIDCEPILGYLHRGMEKIAENRSIIQYLPYVTRWDYLATMFTEAITVNAPEFLENIQIPKRASYIRVIMLELSRIASHLLWLGPFMADLGAQTPFFYIFRERELIYDLFEAATGMRMMHNYFRIGGVAADLPYGWMDKCLDFCDYFLQGVVEYQELITQNPIFLERVEGVGFISGEEAVNWGLSGPMLRASGIQWDLRKIDPYESYNQFDWKVQWQKEGDSLARYLVRVGEMRESIKIIQQAVEKIPGGPYENLEARRFKKAKNPEWNDFEYRFLGKKPSPNFELSKQELYVRVEAPKGELGIYLYRYHYGEKYPHRYNNVLRISSHPEEIFLYFSIGPSIAVISILLSFLVIPLGYRFVLADLSIGVFYMDCDFNKKSHFLRTRKNEGLGTLKIPHELMPNSFHLLIDEINSEASSTSKYGFFGWNLWRQPIGFLVIKPNILVLNMVYFILFLT